jgi:hypothetical protein
MMASGLDDRLTVRDAVADTSFRIPGTPWPVQASTARVGDLMREVEALGRAVAQSPDSPAAPRVSGARKDPRHADEAIVVDDVRTLSQCVR